MVLDQANGRIPVLAGTGAVSTKEAKMFTAQALDVGCDGVMLSHPILTRATDDETYIYFQEIATAVDIPILVYNNPGLGRSMSPALIERLADDFGNIVSYKEDDFDHVRFPKIIKGCREKISIFIGNHAAYFSFLIHGAQRVLIAEFQAFPHLIKGLKGSYERRDIERALYYHEMILKMFSIIGTHFVGASFWGRYKAIWRLGGADVDWRVRGPCTPVKPEQLERAKAEFLELDITDEWYIK